MINLIAWSQIEYKLIYVFSFYRDKKKSLVDIARKGHPSFRILAFRMEEFIHLK